MEKIKDVVRRTWDNIAGDWCQDMESDPDAEGITEAVFDADRWRMYGNADAETIKAIEVMPWPEKVALVKEIYPHG